MQKNNQPWTIISLLQTSASYLQKKRFRQPRLEAELLLAHTLKLRRIDLYLQFDRPLTGDELSQYKKLLQRRLTHEPLQYIIGETEFMSQPFYVGPGVLIPRPETEILVEKALQWCNEVMADKNEISILDVGTGCGNISITLALNNNRCRVMAIDVSAEALEYAKKNADRHGVAGRVQFFQHDIRAEAPKQWQGYFDLIVSNPPYISSHEFSLLDEEIKKYEPKEALWGGEDGMDFYRIFANRLLPLLNARGRIFLEIGADMGKKVIDIFKNRCRSIQLFPDLAGRDRVLSLGFEEEDKT